MSKWETSAGYVSESATYAKLIEYVRLASEQAIMMGHLRKGAGQDLSGQGFLAIGELLQRAETQITKLAMSKGQG